MFGYVFRSVDFFAAVPGDLADARFNSVILEHVFRWTMGYENSLWSPSFFYPFENALAFSDNHFGSSIFYVLLRLAGFRRELAFDGWFLIGNSLNFLATYIALRRLGLSSMGSAAGAFVFSFSLPVLFKEAHAQLVYRFAIPLAYAAFWELLSKRHFSSLWCVALWVTLQFYCSIYLGVFLVYLLAATFASTVFLGNNRFFFKGLTTSIYSQKRSVVVYTGAVVALCVLAVIWLLHNYHAVSVDYGFKRSLDEIATMLPRLSSYLIADRASLSSWVGLSFKGIPMRHEHQMFFGFGVWVIGIYGVVLTWWGNPHKHLGKVVFLSFLILFAVTLNVVGYSLYFLVTYAPGVGSIRAVSRIILVMMLPVGILVAIGAEQLYRRADQASPIGKAILGITLMALLGTEVVAYKTYNTPIEQWISRENALRSKLPTPLPADPILYVTKGAKPFSLPELDGMILAQNLGIPTLNGYSGNTPPGYLPPLPHHTPLDRLNAYAIHRHLTPSTIQAMADRVVTALLSPCEHTTTLSYISAEQAKGLILNISSVQIADARIEAEVIAHNTTLMCFNTVSTQRKPIRLSWRLVPISPSGDRLAEPGWDTRQNLTWTLEPGQRRSVRLFAGLPKAPGSYLLEVSLVQEYVAWLHHLGMGIASTFITVDEVRSLTHD
jgi:hypothetical protein